MSDIKTKELFSMIQMQACSMIPLQGDEYFEQQNILNSMLKDLMHMDSWIDDLSKDELIQVLALCSSHRPREPHSVLLQFNMYMDKSELDSTNISEVEL